MRFLQLHVYMWWLSSPHKLTSWETMDSLVWKMKNWEFRRYLVKILMTWSDEGIQWMLGSLLRTLSWMKWRSSSICFKHAGKNKVTIKKIARWLSNQTRGGALKVRQGSFKRDCTQVISTIRDAKPWHSDSMLLRETTCYFIDDHEIKFGSRKM